MGKEEIRLLRGGNMDIDLLLNPDISWHIEPCPWNEDDGGQEHKCAIKNTSICKYFRGIESLDNVRCAYPEKNDIARNSHRAKIGVYSYDVALDVGWRRNKLGHVDVVPIIHGLRLALFLCDI